MRVLDDMAVTAKRDEVLTALRAGREDHIRIVAEARAGYLVKAKAELQKRLGRLEEGHLDSLVFGLPLPMDQTSVYDTAIRMLELHQGAELTLNAEQVRSLVQNQWDWTRAFYMSTAQYSGTAAERRHNMGADQ